MPALTFIDDAVSEGNNEFITPASTRYGAYYLGYEGGDLFHYGARFQANTGGGIPQGATITSASIQVSLNTGDYDGGLQMRWRGYLATAVSAFASHSHALTGHATLTTATVSDNNWANTSTHTSPSLITVIQEIVDQAGWPDNGVIGILAECTGSNNQWSQITDNSAVLTVEWTVGGSTYSVTSTMSSGSSTPDTPVPAVERSVVSDSTSLSATPDTVALSIQKLTSSAVSSFSETPNTPILEILRSATAATSSNSSTPDDAMLSLSGEITSTMNSASTTPDTVTLTVLRSVTSVMSSLSGTPNGAQLGLILPTASAVSSDSSTPDTPVLSISRSMISDTTSLSSTPDTGTLSVLRSILSVPVSLSSTPETALLDMRQPGSLEFFGGGNASDVDKVYIPCGAGAAVNVGQADFTIDMWIWVPSDLQNGSATAGANYSWINSPIVYDRDTFGSVGSGGDFGIALTAGAVTFGIENSSSSSRTIIGTSDLRTNSWHHIAVTRSRSTGDMAVFVDGDREVLFSGGPGGDIHFAANSDQTGRNPYICIGGEKHELDWPQGQFTGLVADLRISSGIRYSGTSYTVPASMLAVDGATLGLYHFNDGTGTTVSDSTANGNDASFTVGGPSSGPQWSALTPYGGQIYSVVSSALSGSSTPDNPVAAISRSLAATLSSGSETPDTPILSVIRSVSPQSDSLATTPDTSLLSLSMSLSGAVSSGSSTPDDALLTLLISALASISSGSSTPDDVILEIEGFITLVSSLASGSTTPDAAELLVSRSIQTGISSGSSTPDNATLSLLKSILSAATSVSTTPNTAMLSLAFPVSSSVSSGSSTPDTPIPVISRSLSSTVSSASSTPDIASLTLLMSILATVNSLSTTPDTATLLTFIEGSQAVGIARITFIGIKERSVVSGSTITIQGV